MFSAITYTDRRTALAESLSEGIVFLPGNGNLGINYSANHYHFRQDSNFLYFVGIDRPGLAATIDVATGHTILYGDEYTMDDIVWTGPVVSIAEQGEYAGIVETRPMSSLAGDLADRKIHFTPPYRAERTLWISELLGLSPKAVKEKVSEDLIKAIVKLRSIKTQEEVNQIQVAVQLTCNMHHIAMVTAQPGLLEAHVNAGVRHQAMISNSLPSFPVIFTHNGQTLHNHSYANTLESGRMALCDCGGQSPMYYAGDMTRTFPVDPKFTEQQKNVYNIVLNAQKSAVAALKPGYLFKDAHLLAATKITEGLKDLGLMKGNVDEAVKAGAHALFFPHGLGHMMGLDVHDMEDLGEDYVGYDKEVQRSKQFGLAFLRLGRALQAGFVLTVEPGIYFIPDLIDQWKANGTNADFLNFDEIEKYRDFGGIRIEDDYLISENGPMLFVEPFTKTVEEIEELRQY